MTANQVFLSRKSLVRLFSLGFLLAMAQASAQPPNGGSPGAPFGSRTAGGSRASRGIPSVAAQMFVQADKNNDGGVTKDELTALAGTWYEKLASGAENIRQEQLVSKLKDVLSPSAPSAGTGAGRDSGSSVISYEILGPILFTAVDTDKDGSLSRVEFEKTFSKWFDEWDSQKAGRVNEESMRKGLEVDLPRSGFGSSGGEFASRSRTTVSESSSSKQEPPPAKSVSAAPSEPAGRNSRDVSSAPANSGREFAAFKAVIDRNIFDSSRRAARKSGEETKPKRVDTVTLVGTLSYDKGPYAFFDGSSSEYRKVVELGKSIASFKVAEIKPGGIRLDAGTNTFQLDVGTQLRREEDGDWEVVGGKKSSSSEGGSSSSSSSDSSGGGDDEIIKRMMQQREQEMK